MSPVIKVLWPQRRHTRRGWLGIVAGLCSFASQAQEGAQPTEAAESAHQVQITSSRPQVPPIAPVTVIDLEQARREGVTTTEDLLRRISINLPSSVTAQAVGGGFGGASNADLRGLGPGHTVVLLNGRRLVNGAQGATAPDLNVIPFAALERVEVLRDGASALYGANAVGGVINVITRDSYGGGQIDLQAVAPVKPGGASRRATLSVGAGHLAEDRLNGLLVVDLQRSNRLRSRDRSCCGVVVMPEHGIDYGSSGTDPANYAQTQPIVLPDGSTDQVTYNGNPAWPSCRSALGGKLYNPGDGSGRCLVDTGPWEDIQPQVTRSSLMGQGTYRINADHRLQTEAFIATSTVISEVAPVRLAGLTLSPGIRYFPGAGITPAPTHFSIDPTIPINLVWRASAAGGRRHETRNLGQRGLLAYEGSAGDGADRWDYSLGVAQQMSRVAAYLAGGYTDQALMQQGLDAGVINPFGAQDAAGRAWIARAGITGKAWSTTDRITVVDAHADRALADVFEAGRPGHLRMGMEASREHLLNWNNQALQSSVGVGGTAALTDDSATRRLLAGHLKLDAPLHPTVDLSLALRGDRYSDLGGTTSHTLAARWRPRQDLTLQFSQGRSFFEPSMLLMYGQQNLYTSPIAADDPQLCPNGVPVPGADPGTACNQFFQLLGGSNPTLKMGHARTHTASLIAEPTPGLRLQADLWWIAETKGMTSPSLQAILANPGIYASRIHRLANGTIDYIDTRFANVGGTRTHGVDLEADVQGVHWMDGTLGFRAQGTYVTRFEYQRTGASSYSQNVGLFLDYTPIPRWQHALSLTYTRPRWSGTIAHRYTSGYWDENFVAPEFAQRVGAWSVFDASVTWTPHEAWTLTVGVSNLLNTAPPFSNQSQVFQVGYDPRISDPTGRAFFVNLGWTFR